MRGDRGGGDSEIADGERHERETLGLAGVSKPARGARMRGRRDSKGRKEKNQGGRVSDVRSKQRHHGCLSRLASLVSLMGGH